MKIAIGYNTSYYAWMFRSNLIKLLIDAGHSVVVFAPKDEYSVKLEDLGVKFVHIPMKMNRNPFSDLALMVRFIRILKIERVDLYLGYTIKPNIYGSLAAHLLGIKVINNIAGLGSTFINDGFTTIIVKTLYRMSLASSLKVFFQNNDDMELFIEQGIVRHKNIDLLPGSGVDLKKFKPLQFRDPTQQFRFLLVARMLWDKGVMEYINAARMVKSKNNRVVFQLLGSLDVDNPAAIPKEKVYEWVKEGVVEYLGFSDDVRNEISNADCVVLPSYREGAPKVLLEAAALGKPLIATNAVGCKDIVDDDCNGFLCNVRDHLDLAKKMMMMASLSIDELKIMGEYSRKKVETQFDEKIVLDKYMDTISPVSNAY